MNANLNSLPDPQDWDWFKTRLEEAQHYPAAERLGWILAQVNRHRPGLKEFAAKHAQHLLESATVGLSPAPDRLFDSVAFSSRLFDTGDVVGNRYTVKRFLGAGGMGEVYEVEDCELHGRLLALKTIRGDLTNSKDAGLRFEREVRAALTVAHPNVCRIFDVGRHDAEGEDRLFLTMELLSGRLLSDRVRPATALQSNVPPRSGTGALAAGTSPDSKSTTPPEQALTLTLVPTEPDMKPLSPAEALPIIRQLADGLAAIHARGIIHRDFKPANVILVPEAEGLRVVIMDFGLARALERNFDHSITQTGLHPGTPAYMAPEQLTGSGPATCSTDVYSLGVTMHEILTGHRYELNGSFRALQQAHVPAWLRKVVVGCLQADRLHRYPDAMAVAAALQRRPVAAMPKWVWVAAGVLLVAIAGYAWKSAEVANFFVPRRHPPELARTKYAEGLDALRSAAPFLAANRFEQALKLFPDYATAAARLAQARLEMDAVGMAKDAALSATSAELVRALDARDRDLSEAVRFAVLGDYEKAIPLFERRVETAPNDDERISAKIDLAREYERANRRKQALELWRSLAGISPYAALRTAVLESSINNRAANAMYDDALTAFQRENNIEGESQVLYLHATAPSMPRALSNELLRMVVRRANMSHDAYGEARAHLALATNEMFANHFVDAQKEAETGMDIARRANIEMVFSTGLRTLGTIALERGDNAKAEQNFSDAVRLARDNRDERKANDNLIALADLHLRIGKSAQAETETQQLFKYYSAGNVTNLALETSLMLAKARREQGKFEAAQSALGDARKIYSLMKPDDPRSRGKIEMVQSQVERFQGHYPAAVEHMQTSLKNSIAADNTVDSAYNEMLLAEDLAMLGSYDEAKSALTAGAELGIRKSDIDAHLLTMKFFADPKSVPPAQLRRAAGGIEKPEDRMAVNVVLLRALRLAGNRKELEAFLRSPESQIIQSLDRECRLELRLARAMAWASLGRKIEAVTDLGDLRDFESHEVLWWRVALLMEHLADQGDRVRWHDAARQRFEKFRETLGPSFYTRFVNYRRDLSPEISEVTR